MNPDSKNDDSQLVDAIVPRRAVKPNLSGLRAVELNDKQLDRAASAVMRDHGAGSDGSQDDGTGTSVRTSRDPMPRSPIAPDLDMPLPGEGIEWGGNFRAEIPKYVMEQLAEYCHRRRRTQVAALLEFLDSFETHLRPGDKEKRKVFYIRAEDMVPDRRKVVRRR